MPLKKTRTFPKSQIFRNQPTALRPKKSSVPISIARSSPNSTLPPKVRARKRTSKPTMPPSARKKRPQPSKKRDRSGRTNTGQSREREEISGPTSVSGRAASSKNAITHGIFVQDLSKFLSIEELRRYERFVKGIVDDLHPSRRDRTVLARRAADIQFRLEMLRTAEFHAYSQQYTLTDTMPSLIAKHKDPIALVSLYDSRFQRSFKTTMDELHRLQKTRKENEEHALKELREIALQHLHEGTTFEPADFGFVIVARLSLPKSPPPRRPKLGQSRAKSRRPPLDKAA